VFVCRRSPSRFRFYLGPAYRAAVLVRRTARVMNPSIDATHAFRQQVGSLEIVSVAACRTAGASGATSQLERPHSVAMVLNWQRTGSTWPLSSSSGRAFGPARSGVFAGLLNETDGPSSRSWRESCYGLRQFTRPRTFGLCTVNREENHAQPQ
jgi:hypothetical protein